MTHDTQNSGRIFTLAVGAVAALAALGCLVVLAALGPSASDQSDLARTRDALAEVNARPGPLPTDRVVLAWKGYREGLVGVRDEVGRFYRERDGNLEKLFPEFDPRSGGDRYRQLYREKTVALYERATPVLIRDRNGNPAPMKEIFAFEEWDWIPEPPEFRLAQHRFNVQEALVDVLLGLAETEAGADTAALLKPMLLGVRFAPVQEAQGAPAAALPCTAEALLDPRQVQAFAAGVAGPGLHGLLVVLERLSVQKNETLELAYHETVKPDEEPKLKPDGFLRPVRATLGFKVLDLPDEEK